MSFTDGLGAEPSSLSSQNGLSLTPAYDKEGAPNSGSIGKMEKGNNRFRLLRVKNTTKSVVKHFNRISGKFAEFNLYQDHEKNRLSKAQALNEKNKTKNEKIRSSLLKRVQKKIGRFFGRAINF